MTTDLGTRGRSRAGSVAVLTGAAAALLVTGLLHAFVTTFPFPPVAVADTIVKRSPGAVATRSIELLGHFAQPLLVVGTTVAYLGLAAALGALLPRLADSVPGSTLVAAFLLWPTRTQ
jgi:hypothetical protein